MLYLIGGSPRSGKTQLAKKLIRKRPMPCIPTDVIHGTLTALEPELGWDWDLPRMKAARQFQPVLLELASMMSGHGNTGLIEGAVVLPKHVTHFRKKGIEVRCCFMGWTKFDLELGLKYGGEQNWFVHQTPEMQDMGVRDVERFSRYVERECERHDVPYLDMGDGPYREQHRVALEILLG